MSPVVTVQIDAADAIGVAQSIRVLVSLGRIPAAVSEPYLRVAEQMLAAAKAEIANITHTHETHTP